MKNKTAAFWMKPPPTRCWFIYTCFWRWPSAVAAPFFEKGSVFVWHVLVATTVDNLQVRKWRCKMRITVANLLHRFESASTFWAFCSGNWIHLFNSSSSALSNDSHRKSEDQWKMGSFLNESGMCARCEHIYDDKELPFIFGIIYAAIVMLPRKEPQLEVETREVLHKAHGWWVIVRHSIE